LVIAIASGKGGTGKTTLSVALAKVAAEHLKNTAGGGEVSYIDCDVEEPNGHLFLNPDFSKTEEISLRVPKVDSDKCNGCGECAAICRFNAILCLRGKAVAFNNLCHGCGGCTLVCPTGAITEISDKVGVLNIGDVRLSDSLKFKYVQGVLDIGRPMAPPVIRAAKKHKANDGFTVIDSPPGTACPMVSATEGSDYVILVTEPTPFGLHDLKLAVETMRKMSLPFGVIINRLTEDDNMVSRYCAKSNIEVLHTIAESREIAVGSSKGEGLLKSCPLEAKNLASVIDRIIEIVKVGHK
jgi:MinD superfamily P-loop ATPase